MAWSIVGVGTNVTQTAGALTVLYPASLQSGDLIVACVTWRSGTAASPTLPAGGWATAVEELNSNTLTTDQALTCGGIYYIVRGGSNPAAGFTFTNVSVLSATVVVYRGNDTTSPKLADNGGSSLSTASGTGADGVVATGLTTSTANELVVAAFHGSQEAVATAFDAANISVDSGAGTDTTTAPTANTWFRRATATTTSGADCAIAIADGLKASAGPTGSIVCTASVSARHAICAASFKIAITTTDGDAAAAGTGGSNVVGAKVAAATAGATAAGAAIGEGETFDFLEPDGDVTLDGWTDQASGVVNIFQSIDEVVTNDADFVQSPAITGTATDFKVRLYKNAVQIVEWTHANISASFTEIEQTLSGAEVAAIGTFEDLFIEFDDNAGAIYRFALADAVPPVGAPVTVTYRYKKLTV